MFALVSQNETHPYNPVSTPFPAKKGAANPLSLFYNSFFSGS